MSLLYIYYTHHPMEWYHIKMAIESVKKNIEMYIPNGLENSTFLVYNQNHNFKTDEILEYVKKELNGLFTNFEKQKELPNVTDTAPDIEYQIKNLKGYDYYICHKSDFYLPYHLIDVITNIFKTYTKTNPNHLVYSRISKFDMREHIIGDKVREFAKNKTFQALINMDNVAKNVDIQDFGLKHELIGYQTGIRDGDESRIWADGTMHFYNENARDILSKLNKIYFNGYDLPEFSRIGLKPIYGGTGTLYGLHMFHEVDVDRAIYKNARKHPAKCIKGHRF